MKAKLYKGFGDTSVLKRCNVERFVTCGQITHMTTEPQICPQVYSPDILWLSLTLESFRVICPNLLIVCARVVSSENTCIHRVDLARHNLIIRHTVY